MTAYKYITDTGTIVADTSGLLTDVQNEFKAALGANLNTAASTPQGALIAAEVLARSETMRNNAELANVVNPNLAYGTFLDAICSLLGISRGTNQSTIGTDILITGNNLTVIPAGSRLTTSNDDVFVTTNDVTIPISGSIRASIKSQAYGPIALPIGALTILDGTIGWAGAAVDGLTSVTLGALQLSDAKLKNLRNQQLSIQGTASAAAIYAAATAVPNVKSVSVVENNTGATGTVNGITFTKANAIWVCVAGTPDSAAMAQALYDSHNGGCAWDYGSAGNGLPVNSPDGVAAIDPATGLTYNVKWVTPIMHDCYVNITVHQANSVSSPAPSVQNAIVNYANGEESGEPGLVIGADISAFEMAGAVARQLPGMYVKACSVATVPAGNAPPVYPADYHSEIITNQFDLAVIQIGNVTVNVV